MEYVNSFSATKAGKSYVVNVKNFHPDGDMMLFHVDSGASVTFLGLDSFCDPDQKDEYNLLKKIIKDEIRTGGFENLRDSASTATKEEVEMYPCRYDGVSISDTKEIILYFYIYLGDIGMPLLGFDYLDDCSYHHTIGGDLIIIAVAKDVGKRFYPDKVIDFNKVLIRYNSER